MACNLHEAIEYSKAYSAGDFRIDCVEELCKIKKMRDRVLMHVGNRAHDLNSAGIYAVMEVLYKRCCGEGCTYRPMDMIYLGTTKDESGKAHESMLECKRRFMRRNPGIGQSETIDILLPLTTRHEINYCIDTVQALAQLALGQIEPPGPATPPPDN